MKFAAFALVALATFASAEGPVWTTLFDGKTLAGWRATSDANWRVEDGAITVDDGSRGFLIHEGSYTNYELEIEFKAAAETNSGVFLNTTEQPAKLSEDCYELNIAPPDNPFPTGSLVARKKHADAGESDAWRKFEARVKEGHVVVKLDGIEVMNYKSAPPASGTLISLQKNQGRVAFRHIRVRPLP